MEIPFWAFSKQPPKQSGELKPYGLARLLRTVWKWYQVPNSEHRQMKLA